MRRSAALLAILALAGGGSARGAETPPGWHLVEATAEASARLVYGFDGEPVTYVFTCAAGGVRLNETGVTGLMDVHGGQPVPPGGPVPEAASMMALYADGGRTPLTLAVVSPDADKGWILSIVVPLDDPVLQSLAISKKVQLATSGWNGAADVEDADRPIIRRFLAGCAAK